MNGTTKGGLVGNQLWRVATAMADDKYHITGFSLGSGTLVTPFANAW